MTGAFYISASESYGGTWYMLNTRKTHFCISCGMDLEKRLKVLKSCVKDYRTEERLLDSLSRLDCEGKVSPATFAQREDYYLVHGKDYEDLVKSIVLEALAEAREEDKANSPLRKTKSRLQKAGWQTKSSVAKEVSPRLDPEPKKDSPKILRKPRVFNRK